MPLGNDVAGLRDNRIAGAARTERKWSAKTSVDQAEGRHHCKHEHRATGSENVTFPSVVKRQSVKAERRTMVQTEVRRTEEDQRKARSTVHGKQGAWMKWDLPERKLTWTELRTKDQFRISFLLG